MGKKKRRNVRELKKITVEVPLNLYNEFMELAVKKFGYYGALKSAITEAMELWVERERSGQR